MADRSAAGGILKKLINDPFDAVDEMVDGFVAAHGDTVKLVGERAVVRNDVGPAKVGIVIGGGSGHEPAFLGYVGSGLADAAAVGNIFAAPPPDVCLDAIRAVSTGTGVLLVFGNYAGDIMNFGIAAERAAAEGIDVRTVLVTDDVASGGGWRVMCSLGAGSPAT
jgi:phosphoenolpyruvate---glycerone phosphotransferase subunit DhaK